MSQLWLRTVVVDPTTKTILRRLPQHRLPENLRVSQLRSYLEQRFGPPLAEHVAGESWMEFENSYPFAEADGARLLAIPLITDPRTQELVSLFDKLDRFADLAEALGAAHPDAKATEASRTWVGPIFNHRYVFQQINDLAAQAARALLLGTGLMVEINKVVEAHSDGHIPTAGLLEAMGDLEGSVTHTLNGADSAMLTHRRAVDLANALEGAQDTERLERLHGEERRLVLQHDEVLGSSRRCERITRDVAQLAFGISACASGPLVERLDRAGVAVLHPPRGSGVAVPLREDGLTLRATSEEELSVELAGVICRILVDRGTLVGLLPTDSAGEGIHMEIEHGDTLLVTAQAMVDETRAALLESSGWREEAPGFLVQRWPSPVRAIVPARVIANALFGPFGLESVESLEVTVVASRDADADLESRAEPGSNGGVM